MKNEPNKAVVPRRLLVTDCACAHSAPSNRLAHLERSAEEIQTRMSNADIIFRIREELDAFERNERTADQLEQILFGHFEALEGIPYSTLKFLHDFEARFVKSQFSDEDPRIDPKETVISHLRKMLEALDQQKINTEPNQAPEPMTMSVTDAAAQPPRQPRSWLS